MTDTNNKNKEVIFGEDIATTISGILQPLGLEETDDETFQKLESGEPFQTEIIINLAREIVLGEIEKKNLASLLQQQLNIPIQTAEKLAKEVEEKILPLIKAVSKEEATKMAAEKEAQEKLLAEEPIIAERPILPLTEKEELLQPSWKKAPRLEKLSPEPKISEETEEEIKKPLKKEREKSKSQDTYREPIE